MATRRGSPLLVGIKTNTRLATDHVPVFYSKGDDHFLFFFVVFLFCIFSFTFIRIPTMHAFTFPNRSERVTKKVGKSRRKYFCLSEVQQESEYLFDLVRFRVVKNYFEDVRREGGVSSTHS